MNIQLTSPQSISPEITVLRQLPLDDQGTGTWWPARLDWAENCLEEATPQDILLWASHAFKEGLSLGTAFGVSGMVLIDMALKIQPEMDIFYIDTGFFFPETLELIDQAQDHYGRDFRRVTPEVSIREQAQKHGPELYVHNPHLCCHIRKLVPLGNALDGQKAWATAVRRDQSPTRAHTPVIQWNTKHKLIKLAPLARWTEADVWSYVYQHDVPFNALHDQNYPSIGCWPCTSPVAAGEDARAGRWRGLSKTECGLHLVQ